MIMARDFKGAIGRKDFIRFHQLFIITNISSSSSPSSYQNDHPLCKGLQVSEREEGFRRGSEIFCWSSLLRGRRQDRYHDGGDYDDDGDVYDDDGDDGDDSYDDGDD